MEDQYTKTLLHFDGTNGSTTITDATPIPRIWTNNGVSLSTSTPKFGTASAYFNGSAYIDTPDSDDFNFSNTDFTIDFWIKRGNTGVSRICGQNDSNITPNLSSLEMYINTNNYISTNLYYGSSFKNINSSVSITNNEWHHVALIRYGNTVRLYLDGLQVGSVDVSGVTLNNSTKKFAIGITGEYAVNAFVGNIDEFRVSKGIARWTANFTPPTYSYSYGWPGKIYGLSVSKICGVAPQKVMGI